jgi:hypothetical protein
VIRLAPIAPLLSPLIAVQLLALSASVWRDPFPPAGQQGLSSGRPISAARSRIATQVDSQRVLEGVRSQQSRFERLRRSRLYRGARSPGRRCHEIIGRYCLRHGDDEGEPHPEPAEVEAARDELLVHLDRAARSLPGDEWIAGQRVRYLVEAGRRREARQAARACRAVAGWWCTALHGYALHSAGEFAAADSAFSDALSSMPEEERCRWTDITDLLSDGVRRHYSRLSCEERAEIEARFWWLADPLYVLPANDRRTEHFARRTLDRMQNGASSAFGTPWGSDLRELLVRYGWPGRFERVSYATGTGGIRDEIVSYNPQHSRQFAPVIDFVREVDGLRRDTWQLDSETPRSVYAPTYASSFQALDHQLAVFPRGDSAIIVAAFQLVAELPVDTSSYEAALILAPDPVSDPAAAGRRGIAAGVLAVAVEATPTLLSLEMLSRADRRAARSRYGLRLAKVPAGLLALSDLLLLERADTLPDSLAAAVPLARPLRRVNPGERLAVYWEVYGLGPRTEALAVSLTLAAEGAGWLRKAVEWLGLASREQPLTLAWREAVPSPTAILARSLAIDLPADLRAGEYTLKLEVTPSGRETLTSVRSIAVGN